MKKIMLLGSLLLFVVSCTTDSVENTNETIIGYKRTTQSDNVDPSIPDYTKITIGNLSNGKLFSETTEEFINGVSQGAATTQQFFYSNNLLEMRVGAIMDIYYYYDSNNNLIGATGMLTGGGQLNERYVHHPNNIVFCEKLDLPYNDPGATVWHRSILQLNSEGDVISAGFDSNLDGVAENVVTYTYTNGNLTAFQDANGSVINYNYSTVIDTHAHLQELSCGKQVLQFPCADTYAGGSAFILKYNKYITADDLLESTYQVMPSGFYNKKTITNLSPSGNSMHELEFFFN